MRQDRSRKARCSIRKKKVILDYALERQNELIKMEYEKSQKENKDLKAENEKLKKALKKKKKLRLLKDCKNVKQIEFSKYEGILSVLLIAERRD